MSPIHTGPHQPSFRPQRWSNGPRKSLPEIIDAVARRQKARLLPDGITAANQLGLTDAVPAKVTIHTDARLRPIHLDQLVIDFKLTAPSRLYWAGHPAMRIVQALHWLHDMLPADSDSTLKRIRNILQDAKHGNAIRDDLRSGLDALPGWMRDLVTRLLQDSSQFDTTARKNATASTKPAKPAVPKGNAFHATTTMSIASSARNWERGPWQTDRSRRTALLTLACSSIAPISALIAQLRGPFL